MSIWLLCAAAWATPIAEWSFDSSDGGFVPSTGLQWQWGPEETGRTGWSTRLNALYLNDAADELAFPYFDLSGTERPVLGIEHAYSIDASGEGDSGWLEVWLDGEWAILPPVYGYPFTEGFTGESEGVLVHWFDLSSLGVAPTMRMVFQSDAALRRLGWSVYSVSVEDGDPIPPHFVEVSELGATDDVVGPYVVTATILDDQSVEQAEVYWETDNGESGFSTMENMEDGQFRGAIEGQAPGSVVEWWIEASDGTNRATWPKDGKNSFTVSLPAPFDVLTDPPLPSGRTTTSHIDLLWTAPTARYPISGYQVERDGNIIERSGEERQTIELVDGAQVLTVRAIYDTDSGEWTGSSSGPLPLQVSLPTIDEIYPDDAWPGDHLRVKLTGENLYLQPVMTSLNPGLGIEVETFEVIDAHAARALLYVTPEATPGLRTFSLHIGDTAIVAELPFEVRGEGDRPVVLGAHPTSVRQGAHTTVFIDMSVPVDMSQPAPDVYLGEGIIVENVSRRSTGLDITLSVAHDAPLGAHPIEVDEGFRLISGASLEVRDTPKVPSRNCSTLVIQPGSLCTWLIVLSCWARRRKGTLNVTPTRPHTGSLSGQ